MEPWLVTSLVRRHWRGSAFGAFRRPPELLDTPVPLEPDETVIGWYCNPAPWEAERIVFSDHAVYLIRNQAVRRIAIDDISGYTLVPPVKHGDGVEILTSQGPEFIHVAGRSGPHDVYTDRSNFEMFLRALAL